jgi:hypothetical protein
MSRANSLIAGVFLAAAALPAAAQNLHVNDAAYVGIARCQGLINSDALQPQVDPAGINRFMNLQSAGRTPNVVDQATSSRTVATRAAQAAGPDEKALLIAERDGPCRRWSVMGARAPTGALTGN